MKYINLILAVYIALLSSMACNDGDTCADEKTSGKEILTASVEHSDADVDFCSPFCVCSCCHMQINQPSYFYFQFATALFTDKNSILTTPSIKFISRSIWQPPKLF